MSDISVNYSRAVGDDFDGCGDDDGRDIFRNDDFCRAEHMKIIHRLRMS